MKKEIPVPVIAAVIVVIVGIVGFFGYRTIAQPKPAHIKGGVHVTPPNNSAAPGSNAPKTGG